MKITNEIIEYIEVLAKLKIKEEDRESTRAELEKILSYMAVLDTLDTSGAEAMSHVVPVSNVFRNDEVKPSMRTEDLMLNVPEKESGCFKVPRTVE